MVDDLKLRMLTSRHHVEVNLSEATGYEKHVVVELFKETYGKVINTSLPCIPENCHGTLRSIYLIYLHLSLSLYNAKGVHLSII